MSPNSPKALFMGKSTEHYNGLSSKHQTVYPGLYKEDED